MNKNENKEYCCVCGKELDKHEVKEVEIKGVKKKFCKGCLDTIHGLV